MADTSRELYTTGDVARMLKVKPYLITYVLRSGGIEPSVKLGNARLFTLAQVEEIRAAVERTQARFVGDEAAAEKVLDGEAFLLSQSGSKDFWTWRKTLLAWRLLNCGDRRGGWVRPDEKAFRIQYVTLRTALDSGLRADADALYGARPERVRQIEAIAEAD